MLKSNIPKKIKKIRLHPGYVSAKLKFLEVKIRELISEDQKHVIKKDKKLIIQSSR
jgi:hypothetical protein